MPENTKKAPRNDSYLNTGLSSAVQRRHNAKAALLKREREEKRGRLTPQADIILEWIKSEKEAVYKRIAAMPIGVETTEEAIKSVLLAYQMHLTFLDSMKNKAKGVLRTMPKDEVKQGDSFDEA